MYTQLNVSVSTPWVPFLLDGLKESCPPGNTVPGATRHSIALGHLLATLTDLHLLDSILGHGENYMHVHPHRIHMHVLGGRCGGTQ